MDPRLSYGVQRRMGLVRSNPDRFTEEEQAWAELPATEALASGDYEEASRLRRVEAGEEEG